MARPLGSGPIHVYIGYGPPEIIPASTRTLTFSEIGPDGVTLPSGTVVTTPAVLAPPPVYYGTTRSGPEIIERLYYRPLICDVTGPDQSYDMEFVGREDDIFLVMSSWNQAVENELESLPFTDLGFNPATRGTLLMNTIGSFMVVEGQTVGIWLVKAGASRPINVAANMPRGRYYPTCIMTGPNRKVEGNKENLMVRLFTAKLNVRKRGSGKLPLFLENDASFSGLPERTFS